MLCKSEKDDPNFFLDDMLLFTNFSGTVYIFYRENSPESIQ